MAGEETAQDRRKTWDERRRTEAQWYVVEAFEGKDFEVCRQLAASGFYCWRPVVTVTETRRVIVGGVEKRKPIVRKKAVFGRYVFLHEIMTMSIRTSIEQSPEVKGFVCLAGSEEPASIPEKLINYYQNGERAHVEAVDDRFAPTDKVRIAVGPATGVIGVVKSVSNMAARIESRNGVWAGPLVVPLEHLELVEKGAGRVASSRKRKTAHA
jgi:transcription antitermination factor NusG